MFDLAYIYIYDFGSVGNAENLCRDTIKMLNTQQIVYVYLYIYIRNPTVRTSPHLQFFNTVLIRISIEKSIHQNQDLVKS